MNRHTSVRMKIKRRRGGLPRRKHITKGGSWWKWILEQVQRKRRRVGPVYETVDELMAAEKPTRKAQRSSAPLAAGLDDRKETQ